ncbi:MAG: 23S rRNA (uracil(1939)-C(5))-methyltransferase RlmD [Bacilli bacterium]|jgi:23S rRNA (uracil1939-C5)-methyltransferase|nr:23S rRNA (uracil(1939)-C(5))-methyltransferase RlmD [Bacilli bacterium]
MKNNKEIEIKKIGINGEGIGYLDKTVVFVENALVNEVVTLKDIVNHKGYFTAKVDKYINKSKDRIKPKCKYFNKCQVCSLMPLKYNKQLVIKEELVKESLIKYAGIEVEDISVYQADNQFNYRNSIKLPFFNVKDKLALGLYLRNTNHFVYLNDCVVQDNKINDSIKQLLAILDEYRYKAYDKKTKIGLRYLVMRVFNDEIMITLVTGKNTRLIDEVIDKIMNIDNVVSLNQSTNTKNIHEIFVEPIKNIAGKKSINVRFDKYTYKLSSDSFFQLNTNQALKLYQLIKDYLGNNNDFILDLYCGIGSITTYINECAKEIIGIEINKSAIRDAKENAKKHRITNTKYVCGDVEEKIKTYAKNRKVDAIIVDPPRTGLSENTINSIIKSKTNKLIYVSCNPATLAKDLNILLDYYNLIDISIVDMFAQTAHVESVVLLIKK